MRAAGRTITAGELAEHFGRLDPNEPVKLAVYGDCVTIIELTEDTVIGDEDEHPYQDAYGLLEELHEFTGTKKAMLQLVSDYFKGQ